MESLFPDYRENIWKKMIIFVLFSIVCSTATLSCSRKNDIEKNEKITLPKTVEENAVYYQAESLHLYETDKNEIIRVVGAAGSENTIAVLIYIDRPFTGEYQVVFLDKNGREKSRLYLKELIDDSIESITDVIITGNNAISVLAEPIDETSSQTSGEIWLYSFSEKADTLVKKTVFDLGGDFQIKRMIQSDSRNFYVLGSRMQSDLSGQIIFAFDEQGNKLFEIDDISQGWSIGENLFSDGTSVYVDSYLYSESGTAYGVRKIDEKKATLDELIQIEGLEIQERRMHSDNGYISTFDATGVFNVNLQERVKTPCFYWKNQDIDLGSMSGQRMIIVDQDTIFAQFASYELDGMVQYKTYLLKKQEKTPHFGKSIIYVGGIGILGESELQKSVYEFNQNSASHRIELLDYADMYALSDYENYEEMVRKINLEIFSESMPDILYGNDNLQLHYFTSRGLLTDLYPLIEADEEFHLEDVYQNLLELGELNGSLFQIYGHFQISGFAGASSLVGNRIGWTLDEFNVWVNELPETMTPLINASKEELLQGSFDASSDSFVDFITGNLRFDSNEFLQILNYAKTYGKTFEEVRQNNLGESSMVQENELALLRVNIRTVEDYAAVLDVFKEPVSIIGFPTPNKVGPVVHPDMTFAITESSEKKNEAWQFVKNVLYKQSDADGEAEFKAGANLAVLKKEMEEQILSAMTSEDPALYDNPKLNDGAVGLSGKRFFSKEEAEVFRTFIQQLNMMIQKDRDISNILSAESISFFAGQNTDTHVAEEIQAQVQSLLNERK